MKRLCLACACLLAVAASTGAEEPPGPRDEPEPATVTLAFPGEESGIVVQELATQLNYRVSLLDADDPPEGWEELCWVLAKEVSPDDAASYISESSGLHLYLDHRRRLVQVRDEYDPLLESRKVHAYRVAKHVKRHLEYVNRYGRKTDPEASVLGDGETGAEVLVSVLATILAGPAWEPRGGTAVGNRILFTLPKRDHARIRELLDLLLADGVGESRALKQDRANRAALASVHPETATENTPSGEIIWRLCMNLKTPVLMNADLLDGFDFEDDSVDFDFGPEDTVLHALESMAERLWFGVDAHGKSIRLRPRDEGLSDCYRVFELSALLDELNQAYLEQHTEKGRKQSYDGDLSTEGGIDVVVQALESQLANANLAPVIASYGSRLIVAGGVECTEQAAAILRELGWKPAGTGKKK